MTTTCLDTAPTSVPVVPRRPARGRSFLSGLAALQARIVRERRLRRTARELESMSDQALSDIGIARGDIEDAVRNGRPWREGAWPRR